MPSILSFGGRTISYVSTMARPFTDVEFSDIADSSKRWNVDNNITGILLTLGDHFFQVLEGPVDPVGSIFERIKIDPRHHNVVKVLDERINGRAFPDWGMRYVNVTSDEQDLVLTALFEREQNPSSGEAAVPLPTARERGSTLAEGLNTEFKSGQAKEMFNHLLYALETIWMQRADPTRS
jgi:hypothetical protein